MNWLQIAGHLGADAETRFTPSGQKVTTLRVGCNSKKAGKDETMWWEATLWGETFDRILPYLKKGSAVILTGEMSKPEIYSTKDGRQNVSLRMRVNDVRFSPFGRTEKSNQEAGHGQTQQQSHQGSNMGESFAGVAAGNDNADDEMPF